MSTPSLLSRYQGALFGLATGDALGTSVEFKARDTFAPLTDMVGGGVFRLAAGQWTDDTSMALCLAESLVKKQGFDALDQMQRYVRWRDDGYLSSTGHCFDIGMTVNRALSEFTQSKNPYSGSTDPHTAGNGALMRLAPIPLFYRTKVNDALHYAKESARTTHGAPACLRTAEYFAALLLEILAGTNKNEILQPLFVVDKYGLSHNVESTLLAIYQADYVSKTREHIHGTGYVLASLEAALWCFYHTTSFEDAVLMAANLGDDADTTAAIVGQLAGAYYGIAAIPKSWRDKIYLADLIMNYAQKLYDLSHQYHHNPS